MKNIPLCGLVLLGSIATPLVLATAPVQAYTVSLNGRTAGNPAGQPLFDVNLTAPIDVGRTLDPFTWSLPVSNPKANNTVALAATAIFKVVTFSPNQLVLDITLFNKTLSTYQAAIVSMGFGITPNVSSISLSQPGGSQSQNNVFTKSVLDPSNNFPGGFKNIDICIFAANNCSGGNINKGLQAGQFDNFLLTINGNFGTSPSVTLSDFALKFQTQDGSYELAAVPEPITVVGSGMALGFGALMQRKVARQKRSKEKVTV